MQEDGSSYQRQPRCRLKMQRPTIRSDAESVTLRLFLCGSGVRIPFLTIRMAMKAGLITL